jgi:membrane-associated phospholipid phosphatase
VIGTGNHWILDVVAGWALVIVAMWLVDPWFADQRDKVAARVTFNPRIETGTPEPSYEPIKRLETDSPCPPREPC